MSDNTQSENQNSKKILVRVEHMKKHFPVMRGMVWQKQVGAVKAVDNVSFEIRQGETLGVVGESGCGKSTTGRVILQLQRASSGRIFFEDTELTLLSEKQLRPIRPRMQMIFQDSYDSLNPRHSVGQIIAEPMVIQGTKNNTQMRERVMELLELVGLNPNHFSRFPHEFSGGQRQRINIARALALNPDFIVCDEPISALDVSIQAQMVNLFEHLQKRLGLTYMFISHDLSMVQHISNRVAVMYLGKVMELADRDDLFNDPLHPYTQALISAVPTPDPKQERSRMRVMLKGEVPSPANPPRGCVFNTRCPLAQDLCGKTPEYREVQDLHFVACHLADSKGGSKIN
ncbi:MAG: ATP-binding cassette domain-containing protein [Desulfobacteraceae bacterium]|nr:ATP-binding cassette domain-containing protein [Desulfobacteraceae bacterium]